MKAAAANFQKLSLQAKYKALEQEGEFVASRVYSDFNIHLFTYKGLYVEVWKKIGINYIYWIDVVSSQDTLNEYLENIELDGLEN